MSMERQRIMATMATTRVPELVAQKLEAFESIQAEFEKCFRFVQEVHGQRRFSSFPIGEIVYYLHALWLCECKDRLLSIDRTIQRYEGRRCLELLRIWQEGRNAPVVGFLFHKLDLLSFADITAQIEEARHQRGEEELARRLEYGRLAVLNRGMNLMHALEAIFSLGESDLLNEVRPACAQYGHTPEQIEGQLAALKTPLYAYRPHQLLAQRNIMVMNKLNVEVLAQASDLPGERVWSVRQSDEPRAPFAHQVIAGYFPMLAPMYNNLRQVRFIDRTDPISARPT